MPEEEFVPGVDPGVKAWLKMRQDVRDARSKGSNTYTITSDIPYKYHYHWIDLLFAFEEEDMKKIVQSNRIDESSWNKVSHHNICTNDEYEALLLQSRSQSTGRGGEGRGREIAQTHLEKLYYSAIYHRSLILLVKLIEREGYDINYQFTTMRRTLIQFAVQQGDLQKVRYLSDHGANVSIRDLEQRNSLHLAMHKDSLYHPIEIPQLLIRADEELVNSVDNHQRTPLHYACLVGNSYLVRLLLENGADMTKQDERGKMPLDYTTVKPIHGIFAEFSMFHGKKHQFLKLQARTVARQFINDIFQVVQPKCSVCKRTLSNCKTLKLSNYRYWMHAHSRFKKEMYKPKEKL